MRIFLGILLVLFLVLAIVGFAVKALLWLAGVGIALFAITVIYWIVRAKLANRRKQQAAQA